MADAPARQTVQWLVVCLCATWCRSCEAFRPDFDRLAREPGPVRLLWLDIEDSTTLLPDDIEIENFPTILLARASGDVMHFGPMRPSISVLQGLIRARTRGDATPAILRHALATEVARRVLKEFPLPDQQGVS